MKKKTLAVVHWFPVEHYPPATNLLTYFGSDDQWQVAAFTTSDDSGLEGYTHPNVTMRRWAFPGQSLGWLRRWVAYFGFPIAAFLNLIFSRPDKLLYVEPHSAIPAFLYCLVAPRCQLYIHYHEYYEPEAFRRRGMRLVRLYRWIEEVYLFQRAEWISQTNPDRLRLFQADHSQRLPPEKLTVLPNYPPRSWYRETQADWQDCRNETLKLVYVGSISLHDTFIELLVEWIRKTTAADVTLDIFSYKSDSATRQFLQESRCERIDFHPRGVAYAELPVLLRDFHVGLILYRANTQNYVYNASNKLFEYLAIGLDVWFPSQMLGVKPFSTDNTRPRILETNYEELDSMDLNARRNRSGLPPARLSPCYEDVLSQLKERMLSDRPASSSR